MESKSRWRRVCTWWTRRIRTRNVDGTYLSFWQRRSEADGDQRQRLDFAGLSLDMEA